MPRDTGETVWRRCQREGGSVVISESTPWRWLIRPKDVIDPYLSLSTEIYSIKKRRDNETWRDEERCMKGAKQLFLLRHA
jgi:hypothetical protein